MQASYERTALRWLGSEPGPVQELKQETLEGATNSALNLFWLILGAHVVYDVRNEQVIGNFVFRVKSSIVSHRKLEVVENLSGPNIGTCDKLGLHNRQDLFDQVAVLGVAGGGSRKVNIHLHACWNVPNLSFLEDSRLTDPLDQVLSSLKKITFEGQSHEVFNKLTDLVDSDSVNLESFIEAVEKHSAGLRWRVAHNTGLKHDVKEVVARHEFANSAKDFLLLGYLLLVTDAHVVDDSVSGSQVVGLRVRRSFLRKLVENGLHKLRRLVLVSFSDVQHSVEPA